MKQADIPPLPPEQGDVLFSSAMAKAGEMAKAGKDAHNPSREEPDAVERLATRTGRILGFIALPALAWLFGHQLGWW